MANEIDVCNLALAHIGDTASVASISPPEGSVQAEHCARFLPIARDAILTGHDWRFATRRAPSLAQYSVTPPVTWTYAFAPPSNMLKIQRLIPTIAVPWSTPNFDFFSQYYWPTYNADSPRLEYEIETLPDGQSVIYTNVTDFQTVYTVAVNSIAAWPVQLATALSYRLAAYLAGPITKDHNLITAMMQQFAVELSLAKDQDANQRHSNLYRDFVPASLGCR